jgi:hypothetical protein
VKTLSVQPQVATDVWLKSYIVCGGSANDFWSISTA